MSAPDFEPTLQLLNKRIREDAHFAVWVQLWAQAWVDGHAAGRVDGQLGIERSYRELRECAQRELASTSETSSLRLMEAMAVLTRSESALLTANELRGPGPIILPSEV